MDSGCACRPGRLFCLSPGCFITWASLHSTPQLAKSWARRYSQRCRRLQLQTQEAARQRWECYAREQAQGVLFVHVAKGHAVAVDHTCPECGMSCSTPAALGSHRRKEHGVNARATEVALGTRCDVCCTEYWSTARLREHLRRSEACLRLWEAADRDVEADVAPACASWLPATVAHGPHPWWSLLRPPPNPTAPSKPIWDSRAYLREWLDRESSIVTDTQLLHLVEKGMSHALSTEDFPLAYDFQSPTVNFVQGALWATNPCAERGMPPEPSLACFSERF